MKLLFDENLSRRLVRALSAEFPGSAHVSDVDLLTTPDEGIWEYAQANDLTIVSKDTDFMQMSFLRGAPPKIICIRRGNCSTAEVETILKENRDAIVEFGGADDLTYLLLH